MNSIAENTLCSGCGVCSVICPKNCITIAENVRGELRPEVDKSLCVSCGKCRTRCPFCEETKVSPKSEEKVFIGSAPKFSDNGSSGGIATYFIDSLLKSKAVDYAVLVKPQDNSEELFKFTLCKTTDDLIACQGSAYYPVTLEKILKDIQNIDGSFAVIGVPCFISALKNLKSESRFWDEKLRYLIGIVCGHTPNKHLVDCLALKSGHKRSDITGCRFRIKGTNKPAWDYGVRLTFSDNSELESFGSGDFGFLFWRRLFIQKCCNNCRDVFAENADITFMDAWLPDYKEKTEGTSLLVCRNVDLISHLKPLVEEGNLKETSTDDIYKAQEKLIDYKSRAGAHLKEEKLEQKVQHIFASNKNEKDLIDRIRRLCYKENLKKKNPILWAILEIKDSVLG